MPVRSAECLLVAIFAAVCVTAAVAHPIDFKALSLVPAGAQVVSGFEVRRSSHKTGGGPLQLNTPNNVLDLNDWVALASVDPRRTYSEVMQISLAFPGEILSEHLLLITGSFDTKHIFRAAELNGAKPLKCLGESVLAIEPFEREKLDMPETRWLAVLENRIVVFGTPWMVRQALFRYENRVPVDPVLVGRLAFFNRDVDCWNLVIPVSDTLQPVFLDVDSPWSRMLEDAAFLVVGFHVDVASRVDLFLQTSGRSRGANLNEKAALFSQMFIRDAANEASVRRLRNLEIRSNLLRASIFLSAQDLAKRKTEQFDRSKELVKVARQRERLARSASPPPANSERVSATH